MFGHARASCVFEYFLNAEPEVCVCVSLVFSSCFHVLASKAKALGNAVNAGSSKAIAEALRLWKFDDQASEVGVCVTMRALSLSL